MSINCDAFSKICKYCDGEKLKKMMLLSKEVYDLVKEVNYNRGETFIQKFTNTLDKPKYVKYFEDKGPKYMYNMFTNFFALIEAGKIITSSKNPQELYQEFPSLIKLLDRFLCILNKCINCNITASEFLFDVAKRINLQKEIGFDIEQINMECADAFYDHVRNSHFDRAEEYFKTCNDDINLTNCFILMCEKQLMESAEWVFNFSHSLPPKNKKNKNYNFDLYDYLECCTSDMRAGIRAGMSCSQDHNPIDVCSHHNYVFVKNINDIDMLKFLWEMGQNHGQTINIHADNDRLYELVIKNNNLEVKNWLEEKNKEIDGAEFIVDAEKTYKTSS